MNVPHQMTPNTIKFNDERINKLIDYYYAMGLQQKAVAVLHNLVSGRFTYTATSEDLCQAKEYLDQLEKCLMSENTVLTTHTRSIHSKFSHDTLIFDEDPIGSLVQINQVKISDLFAIGLTLQKGRQDLTNVINVLENANKGEIKSSPALLINLDELVEKGLVVQISTPHEKKPNLLEIEWLSNIAKLATLRQRVTLEEERAIKELVSKYV